MRVAFSYAALLFQMSIVMKPYVMENKTGLGKKCSKVVKQCPFCGLRRDEPRISWGFHYIK